jgi:hypothetical protein
VCHVCPALTVESGASAVFRRARLAAPVWADSNQVDSNQVAAACQVALTADSAAPVCFRRLTGLAWSGSNQADSKQAAAVCQVGPRVDPGGLVCFRPAWSDSSQADSNQAAAACQVVPRVVPDGLVCFRPGSSAGLASADSAGLVSPACSALRDGAPAFPDLDCPVSREYWAFQVLVCREPDGGRREDSRDVQVEVPDGLVAGNGVGDSPSCRGSRDDWPTQSVVDDTSNVADDKDCPSRPNIHGCSKRASLPNSIPNRPSSRDDCPQSAHRCRFQR